MCPQRSGWKLGYPHGVHIGTFLVNLCQVPPIIAPDRDRCSSLTVIRKDNRLFAIREGDLVLSKKRGHLAALRPLNQPTNFRTNHDLHCEAHREVSSTSHANFFIQAPKQSSPGLARWLSALLLNTLNGAPFVFPSALQSAKIMAAKYPKLHIAAIKIAKIIIMLMSISNLPGSDLPILYDRFALRKFRGHALT
jgi:hypothetical protein